MTKEKYYSESPNTHTVNGLQLKSGFIIYSQSGIDSTVRYFRSSHWLWYAKIQNLFILLPPVSKVKLLKKGGSD
ncbi:MAG: hypothetical protein M9959_14065 [Chitinophagaceae bacterium]|nr:hypothetical protein [Chitinophagaceae bacterium]